MIPTGRKETLSRMLMGVSVGMAACQCASLLTILSASFSGHSVSDNWRVVYLLGEIICVIFAIPAAITVLALSPERKGGKAALAFSIGVTVVCGFFMIFPG
jgi:MFS family permease